MHSITKSIILSRIVLLLAGLTNIVIAIGQLTYRNYTLDVLGFTGVDTEGYLLFIMMIISLFLFIIGLWDIAVSWKHSNLLIFGLVLELLKSATLFALTYFWVAPQMIIAFPYVHLAIGGLCLITLIWIIANKRSNQYIFLDSGSLFKY